MKGERYAQSPYEGEGGRGGKNALRDSVKGHASQPPVDKRQRRHATTYAVEEVRTFMAVVGPNSFFALTGINKKQTAVSQNTPEAEIVAAAAAMRTVGLPALENAYRMAAARKQISCKHGRPRSLSYAIVHSHN